MDIIWLKCDKCGYKMSVLEDDLSEHYGEECIICKGHMFFDTDQEEKIEEPLGDNFPKLPDREQEMLENFRVLGMANTWYMIEAFTDIKIRLQYREMFFKCGGKIPLKENEK